MSKIRVGGSCPPAPPSPTPLIVGPAYFINSLSSSQIFKAAFIGVLRLIQYTGISITCLCIELQCSIVIIVDIVPHLCLLIINRRRKSHFCCLIKCCLLKSEHLPTPTDLSILTLLVWNSSFWTKSHTLTPDPPNLTLFSVKSHTSHSFVTLPSQWLQLCLNWLYSYSVCTYFIVNLTDFTRHIN